LVSVTFSSWGLTPSSSFLTPTGVGSAALNPGRRIKATILLSEGMAWPSAFAWRTGSRSATRLTRSSASIRGLSGSPTRTTESVSDRSASASILRVPTKSSSGKI